MLYLVFQEDVYLPSPVHLDLGVVSTHTYLHMASVREAFGRGILYWVDRCREEVRVVG